MTADRSVSLRLDVNQQALTDTSTQHQRDTPREASPESRDAFRQAMRGASTSGPDTATSDGQVSSTSSEETLPRGIPPVVLPPTHGAGRASLDATLQQNLCGSLERLLVSDDNREEVRLDLKDDALPGVSIRILEDEGRLVVCFTCSVDSVRRRLDAAINELAQQLADRLHRDVLLQVQTDDPQDLRLNEALSGPQ